MAAEAPGKSEEEDEKFCVCDDDSPPSDPHTWLMCSGPLGICPGNQWYHLSCAEIEENNVPKGHWYCCDECENEAEEHSSDDMDET